MTNGGPACQSGRGISFDRARSAGVFGRPDLGFPGDGVVVIGPLNAAQWIYGETDCGRAHKVRSEGAVLNHAHWREQPGPPHYPNRM